MMARWDEAQRGSERLAYTERLPSAAAQSLGHS